MQVEAIKLAGWLHERQLELADLRQDLIDEWVAGDSIIRRRVRLFLRWLERAAVTGPARRRVGRPRPNSSVALG